MPRSARRPWAPRRGAILAGACLACVVGTDVSAQSSATEIADIRFVGNRTFSDDSIAATIVNKETACRNVVFLPFCAVGMGFSLDQRYFNAREFPRDVQRIRLYYGARGFREAQVDTVVQRPEDDRLEIEFRIDEGRPVLIEGLRVEGAEGIDGMDVAEIPISAGERLSRVQLNAARDTLVQRLRNRGYPNGDVLLGFDIDNDTPYAAEVTFLADPGPRARFGPIRLANNRNLTEDIVLGLLPFREGDLYSEARVLEGQRNLFNLQMIRSASFARDTVPAADSIVPMVITVAEGDVHRVRSGVGWSTADCVNGEGRWTSRNFRGGARRLQLRARLSNIAADELATACGQAGRGDFGGANWLLSADFVQPRVLGGPFQFSASVFYERQSLQDVYVRQGLGFDVRLVRHIGQYSQLGFFFRPEFTRLSAADVFFCTSFLVCAPDDIAILQDDNWLAPVGLNFTRNRTDDLLNPTSGYLAVAEFEHASGITGSDFGYNRMFADASLYRRIGGNQVLAARVSGGWIGSGSFGLVQSSTVAITPPQKRLYAGGANSTRGFAQNQLGPRVLTIPVRRLVESDTIGVAPLCTAESVIDLSCDANALEDGAFDAPRPTGGRAVLEGSLEYRVAFGDSRVQSALFVDFGKVWNESAQGGGTDLEFTPGFGMRYLSPIGPIRLDVGYNFQGIEALPLVTSQLRPLAEGEVVPASEEVITSTGRWVIVDDLAALAPPVTFGDAPGFSFSRFQLHLSIGQAF